MVFGFTIVEGVETTAPNSNTLETTLPLWSSPLAGLGTDRGTLSLGLTNEHVTHFTLTAMDRILNVIVPNRDDQPRLIKMMEFDRQAISTSVVGFEKAFIQHQDRSVSRLSFAWDEREVGSIDPWLQSSCVCVVSKDYPTICDGARLPKFDEESGRIVQDSMEGIQIFDTALLYWADSNSTRATSFV
jgi:hypothetical protein